MCSQADYLAALQSKLPPFVDSIANLGGIGLAIYNAGTDIFVDDELGRMMVTAEGVLQRDQFVLSQLISRGIPTLMLTSGGYSRRSYQLIADTVAWLFDHCL